MACDGSTTAAERGGCGRACVTGSASSRRFFVVQAFYAFLGPCSVWPRAPYCPIGCPDSASKVVPNSAAPPLPLTPVIRRDRRWRDGSHLSRLVICTSHSPFYFSYRKARPRPPPPDSAHQTSDSRIHIASSQRCGHLIQVQSIYRPPSIASLFGVPGFSRSPEPLSSCRHRCGESARSLAALSSSAPASSSMLALCEMPLLRSPS